MNLGFWKDLNEKAKAEGRPVLVLAPMADVTDAPFRRLFAKYGKPDVIWNEFISCDGMYHTAKALGITEPKEAAKRALELEGKNFEGKSSNESGKDKLEAFDLFLKDLVYTEAERPIVAQIFSGNPQTMEWGAELCAHLGFDGIDINMGCPDKGIEKQGSGASLIKNPEMAQELVKACKRGVAKVREIPITVKTRIGYNKDELEEWLPALLEVEPAVVILHARTRKQMSKVDADWSRIKRAVEIRDLFFANSPTSKTLIFGNGDVDSLDKAQARFEETGCDGIMIGRGIFGNPWFFNKEVDRDKDVSIKERLLVMLEHTKLFAELMTHKNFAVMKKHYKAYVEGFDGAKELRVKLMEASGVEEVEREVKNFINERA